MDAGAAAAVNSMGRRIGGLARGYLFPAVVDTTKEGGSLPARHKPEIELAQAFFVARGRAAAAEPAHDVAIVLAG